MKNFTTTSAEPSIPRAWLSRWALLLALLVGGGLLASSVAPLAWADEDEEEVEYDDQDDEDWEEELEEMEWFMAEIELYNELLELVLTYEEIADDAGKAGVAAVLAVEEHVEEPEDSAKLFEQMLPQVSNPTVERAIRLKLVEVYGDMDQPQKSIEQLKWLIKNSAE